MGSVPIMLAGWLGLGLSPLTVPAGLRLIPELEAEFGRFDAEASVNAFASAMAHSVDSISTHVKVRPYRFWVRYSTARFEARAGLQKINFGSATLLRPLMWFDRLDPRDPLGLTDGVYGLLGRYYFQNNANLWAWGLVGNSEPKGWEYIGSERWRPEFGGRAQLPVPRGELAASYHHRRTQDTAISPFPVQVQMDEDRLGIDGKWDVGVGLWLEGTTMRQAVHRFADTDWWQWSATVGLDYTFGVGNGLAVVAEHMVVGSFTEGVESDEGRQFSALMVSYPLGLLDNLRGIVMYDWSNKDVYSHVGWQRTLDRWMFYFSAFWGPGGDTMQNRVSNSSQGRGVQVMVGYNH